MVRRLFVGALLPEPTSTYLQPHTAGTQLVSQAFRRTGSSNQNPATTQRCASAQNLFCQANPLPCASCSAEWLLRYAAPDRPSQMGTVVRLHDNCTHSHTNLHAPTLQESDMGGGEKTSTDPTGAQRASERERERVRERERERERERDGAGRAGGERTRWAVPEGRCEGLSIPYHTQTHAPSPQNMGCRTWPAPTQIEG
jgi:hypothetical protein